MMNGGGYFFPKIVTSVMDAPSAIQEKFKMFAVQ